MALSPMDPRYELDVGDWFASSPGRWVGPTSGLDAQATARSGIPTPAVSIPHARPVCPGFS
jgi:hypothetical protein